MFCSDLAFTNLSRQVIREERHSATWSDKARNVSSSLLELEQEIRVLRKQMEQMFQQEQSFTADNVIEISSLLDLKINEYMKSANANK
ncbi:aspartyl-phosphate phosphatase Spo0E family protein [Paenibacillus aquistagni]|uniref:aspartyl-phosphate phosphatase Spo0E family protein n=1 Tax=Paenibacillus aquistagni TaxID=1852522 RepID=UPI00145A5FD5|nr:aspartyl-phosphate phosphatase Spo0E family protein [Paenibacillus aquistagni]NMM53843.1 Spo0E family sporulation regulatory protein-aspartic acid phosphatase [Paenibacillus aquistagni]